MGRRGIEVPDPAGATDWALDGGRVQVYEFSTWSRMAAGEIHLIDRYGPLHNAMVPDVRDGVFYSWKPAVR